MKKILALFVCSIIFLSACNKETIRGSGAIISEDRILPGLTEIEFDGEAEADIISGVTQKVTITGYQNLLPVYESRLIGNTLHLGFKPNEYRIKNNNIKVTIALPALSYVRINGSGNINCRDFINGNNLGAWIDGSGSILIENSKYNKAVYSVTGSGNITANTTEAAEAKAEIHGSGNIMLNVTDKWDASLTASASINYWGNPAVVNTQVSGSGHINKKQ